MKTLFVFCLCMMSAMANVEDWTQTAEDNNLALYRKYCSGSSTSGNDGDREWHCKGPKEQGAVIRKAHTHKLDLPSTNKQQLVFIETPSDEYQHDILVTGDVKTNHNTKIVVVPSADKHSYQVNQDVQVDSVAAKPSIFFLRSKPNEAQPTIPRTSETIISPVTNARPSYDYTPPRPSIYNLQPQRRN